MVEGELPRAAAEVGAVREGQGGRLAQAQSGRAGQHHGRGQGLRGRDARPVAGAGEDGKEDLLRNTKKSCFPTYLLLKNNFQIRTCSLSSAPGGIESLIP